MDSTCCAILLVNIPMIVGGRPMDGAVAYVSSVCDALSRRIDMGGDGGGARLIGVEGEKSVGESFSRRQVSDALRRHARSLGDAPMGPVILAFAESSRSLRLSSSRERSRL